jgi:hypothetical protein
MHKAIFAPLKRKGWTLSKVYLSHVDYADMRKFGRNALDINTDMNLLRQGIQGYIWGVEMRTRTDDGKRVPVGTVRVEDVGGRQQSVCLRCKSLFDSSSCQSDLCIVMDVQDS